jgi:hypothetical protein
MMCTIPKIVFLVKMGIGSFGFPEMTKINRRSFLSAAAAAFVMDPERLLWVPGRKVYSILKPQPKTVWTEHVMLAVHPIVRVTAISVNGIRCEFDCHDIGVEPGDLIRLSFPADELAKLEFTSLRTALVSSVNIRYGES